jgi:hypothetical protein
LLKFALCNYYKMVGYVGDGNHARPKMKSKVRALSDKNYREKTKAAKQQLYKEIGEKCFICNSGVRLNCHRKSYEKHKNLANQTIGTLKKEKVTDYVRLCFQCHFGVHWLHNNFGLLWDDILSLKKTLDCQ